MQYAMQYRIPSNTGTSYLLSTVTERAKRSIGGTSSRKDERVEKDKKEGERMRGISNLVSNFKHPFVQKVESTTIRTNTT
jgi:hypothetical protein